MKRVVLDSESPAIRRFIGDLPMNADGVELELNGRFVCRVFPATMTEVDAQSLVSERWDLIRKAQLRTKGIPARELENEIRTAIDEVRAPTHG